MKHTFYIYFLLTSIGFGSVQSQTKIETPFNESSKNIIALDGDWNFITATQAHKPKNASPEAVDKKAVEIFLNQDADKWFDIKTPQFLNRISWWMPNVSMEYEQREAERVKAFPFNAEKLQAGWYNKTLQLSENFSSDKTEIYVNFEGVATVSRVYCNGNYVGGHLGMFGAFSCRLTPYLKSGENEIMVYVERGTVAEKGNEVVSVAVTVPVTRDMLTSLNSGMFGGFGNGPRAKFMGIWQQVSLKISKSGGKIKDVFFNPSLHGHHLRIEVDNPEKNEISGYISYSVKDKETGKLLVSGNDRKSIKIEKEKNKVIEIDKNGLDPKLWTPDDPNLYELEVAWREENGKVIDRYNCQVGYRTIGVKGKNVLLNGKPYWVRGANMPPYGYKPNDEETARAFLQLMHDGNTVVTRTATNPWNHMWYTAADEIGIGVSSEGVRPWALMSTAPPPPKAILEHWKKEQLESIKEYRNHPSILFYELSNEGLQGDYENPNKLAIFKDLIEAVRKMDPSRPIFQTSGDPDVNNQADIEDIHSYWGWYEPSSFVNDYTKPIRGLTLENGRPFINEEAAVPYSMIDDGSVHPNYIPRYSAQSWVGDIGTLGSNHSYFQQHIYHEGKLKAEKLRRSRNYVDNSGFMLFCNSTWIQHALSRPPAQWKPFPVYEGVKKGFQPVLVAMKSTQRNFFAGDTLKTDFFIVNDDTRFRDLKNTKLDIQLVNEKGEILKEQTIKSGDVDYYKVKESDFSFPLPDREKSVQDYEMQFKLSNAKDEQLSFNIYKIKVYKKPVRDQYKKIKIISLGNTKAVNTFLKNMGSVSTSLKGSKAEAIVLGPEALEVSTDEVTEHLKKGGRLLVLQQKRNAHRFCKDILVRDQGVAGDKNKDNNSYMYINSDIFKNSLERSKGEFVEMLGWNQHPPIFKGLGAMDWKWWSMKDSSSAYVSTASHKIDIKNDKVIPLGRYLNSHFYWQGNLKKIYQNTISYPVFAINKKYGQLVVSELNITQSIATDPRAAITLRNLILAPIKEKYQ